MDTWEGRPLWYDRQGEPISYEKYASLKYQSDGYFRIAEDTLADCWVSTVWLGIDHGMPFRNRQPIIFETMVFGGDMDTECWRYTTEAQARKGHRVITRMARDVARVKRRRRFKTQTYRR